MTAPRVSTCTPWATPDDVADGPCTADSLAPTLLTDALQAASDVLFDLTGRRWSGTCSRVVRPVEGDCRRCVPRRSGRCERCCGRRLSQVRLPGVVTGVTEVRIDGSVLSAARYRVDGWKWLVYLPESDTAERQGWPCCQRLDLPTTAADTWSVSYSYGLNPPVAGKHNAAALGCQLALAWKGDTAACKLPKRVTTMVRQGVTLAALDPLTLFKDGLTGLGEVDLWVASVNRGAAQRSASVWRPDLHGDRYRQVGT